VLPLSVQREGITFQWEQQRYGAGKALELPGEKKMRKWSCHPPRLAERLKQLREILVAKYTLELHLSSLMFAFVGRSRINKHKC